MSFQLQFYNRCAKITRNYHKYTEQQKAFALKWMEMGADKIATIKSGMYSSHNDEYWACLNECGYTKLYNGNGTMDFHMALLRKQL